jgi:pimeloyl-ACP methyl ester carboxylesterase
MTIEFAFSSQCNDPQIWVWFPGWGFKAEVFTDLARSLPGQHYFYRWSNHHHFDLAVNEVCKHLPQNAILIGWSLGGAIAQAAAQHQPSCAALITLATPPKFCRSKQWPYGMSSVRYKSFVSSFKDNARKALFRFSALNVEGSEKPKAIMRVLAQYQFEPSDALFYQLLWLDQYDFTTVVNTQCLCLHLFAEQDVLVSSASTDKKRYEKNHHELIPFTCHALFIQQPDAIKEHCLNVYAQLNFA